MALDDPVSVAEQYASEGNLRARQSLYEEVSGPDVHGVLWQTLVDLAPRNLLEVGGGEGKLSERVQAKLDVSVSFVDISPRMVELARARGLDAQVGDAQALPFADGAFDAAVAAWMLYHVPDLDRGIAELARVLRPGGALVAVTNSVDHLKELCDLIAYPAMVTMTFNRENGEELLARRFARVDRRDFDVEVTVRDRSTLVAYQQSLQVPTQPVPEDVELPFIVHARVTIFVATT